MKYILTRILLIVPTMLFVSVIAFFLSRMVPGDQADALQILQGINPEIAETDDSEYRKAYVNLNLDKPTFYCSILPNFYPENLNGITNKSRRSEVKSLLRKKYPYDEIAQYLDAKSEFIKEMSGFKYSSDSVSFEVNSEFTNKLNIFLAKVRFTADPDDIAAIMKEAPSSGITLYSESISRFKSKIKTFKTKRITYHYPVFHLHGLNNQYQIWLSKLIRFDFGVSMKDGRAAFDRISGAMKWTLTLVTLNLVFTLLIALPIGVYRGMYPTGKFDRWMSILSLAFYSMPVFWLASMLIIFFATSDYNMKIFSGIGNWYVTGEMSYFKTLSQYSGQLVLPVLCLVLNDIAFLSKLVRVNFQKENSRLFAFFARAKGLSRQGSAYRHVLPNAFIPLITVLAGGIPASMAGALVVEVIFNIPGMGRLMHDSIFSADWNVVFGILVILSFLTALFLLAGDILYAALNPKIKLSD
ncbi:MAG: ABC transporter permease [Saprospiraceae bacterium]|nr:ABC transporter permease [Saprospiraceae bacterium]